MIASDRLLAAIDAGLAEATEAAAWAARAARAAAWAAARAVAAEAAARAAAWAAREKHCRIVRQLIPFAEVGRRML